MNNSREVEEAERVLFTETCEICLWGNATDLSLLTSLTYEDIQKLQGADARKSAEKNVLINDLPKAYEVLKQAQRQGKKERRVDIVLDNAGFELYVDLILAGYLLAAGLATEIVLHPKSMPWFVSDVVPEDFAALLSALAGPQGFYSALEHEHSDTKPIPLSDKETSDLFSVFKHWSSLHAEGQLLLRPNDFWTTACSYWDLPKAVSLYEDLQKSELVIFKGDLNYRKLTVDAMWATTTPFTTAIGPLRHGSGIRTLALRTCKADTVVGLPEDEDERLRAMEGGGGDSGCRKWAWSVYIQVPSYLNTSIDSKIMEGNAYGGLACRIIGQCQMMNAARCNSSKPQRRGRADSTLAGANEAPPAPRKRRQDLTDAELMPPPAIPNKRPRGGTDKESMPPSLLPQRKRTRWNPEQGRRETLTGMTTPVPAPKQRGRNAQSGPGQRRIPKSVNKLKALGGPVGRTNPMTNSLESNNQATSQAGSTIKASRSGMNQASKSSRLPTQKEIHTPTKRDPNSRSPREATPPPGNETSHSQSSDQENETLSQRIIAEQITQREINRISKAHPPTSARTTSQRELAKSMKAQNIPLPREQNGSITAVFAAAHRGMKRDRDEDSPATLRAPKRQREAPRPGKKAANARVIQAPKNATDAADQLVKGIMHSFNPPLVNIEDQEFDPTVIVQSIEDPDEMTPILEKESENDYYVETHAVKNDHEVHDENKENKTPFIKQEPNENQENETPLNSIPTASVSSTCVEPPSRQLSLNTPHSPSGSKAPETPKALSRTQERFWRDKDMNHVPTSTSTSLDMKPSIKASLELRKALNESPTPKGTSSTGNLAANVAQGDKNKSTTSSSSSSSQASEQSTPPTPMSTRRESYGWTAEMLHTQLGDLGQGLTPAAVLTSPLFWPAQGKKEEQAVSGGDGEGKKELGSPAKFE
ncbi:Hairy/enhancer-of-split with YRPW motif protein 2 [Lecanora helva]